MISSAEEFVALRRSQLPEEYLRAARDTASESVWHEVIDRYPEMRIWVAHNKTVSLDVLATLARDPDPGVRSAVAMKNKLSKGLFEALSTDPDESVRVRVAYNKNTPVEIMEQLARDPSGIVSRPALERIQSPR